MSLPPPPYPTSSIYSVGRRWRETLYVIFQSDRVFIQVGSAGKFCHVLLFAWEYMFLCCCLLLWRELSHSHGVHLGECDSTKLFFFFFKVVKVETKSELCTKQK